MRAGYGLEIVNDLYQGYYTYRGHHPSLGLDLAPGEVFSMSVRTQAWLRTYGPDSYAEGGSHIPQDDGARRMDRLFKAGIDMEWQLAERWALVSSASLLVRRTNFPDYEPGIFPSSSSDYWIGWDDQNWSAMLGVAFEG